MSCIYVIHENNVWVEPLRAAFRKFSLPFEEWFLHTGQIDLSQPPPDGVFYNRMSASSHSRGHRFGPEYTAAILAWLEGHSRIVLNGSRALQLEISKVAQYAALERLGIRTPKTIAAIGTHELVAAGRQFKTPFITKHNRAGKGLGVRLFHDADSLETYVNSEAFDPSVDGITLIQEFIESPEACITRVEFVGGRFLYAVRVDSSQGFELCPADACQLDETFCPTDQTSTARFQIIKGFKSDLIHDYEKFLAMNQIHIAGIEFVRDRQGLCYTYDVNTNTNYNADAEAIARVNGMEAIASYLGREHSKIDGATTAG